MTNPGATQQGSDKSAIRPFSFNFTDADLADLRRRINATKWPERELVTVRRRACNSLLCRNSRATAGFLDS